MRKLASRAGHIYEYVIVCLTSDWFLSCLQRDTDKRVGCRGSGAEELKDDPFFNGIDWNVVYQQKYPPPLIPPRGEVNAADAFDIGSFDEEDTKGKL